MADDPLAVLRALSVVREGRVYDLATDLGPETPSGDPATFAPFRLSPFRVPLSVTSDDPPPFDFSMEIVSGSLHVGTHIDGLAHIHAAGRTHGGRSRDLWSDFGWLADGMETVPPFVLRGVLLDVAGHRGVEMIEGAEQISAEEIRVCAAEQGTALTPGCAVLVRTGRIAQFHAGGAGYFDEQCGIGPDAAIWLYENGMRLLGTDTSGTEAQPMPDPARSTHEAMLIERGVHLLEILDLDALARDGVHEFCLIVLPLKIVGATGSWVRPIAIA
ncbi:MAG TPA: cyclase family protein [Pseudolysinimonas sp.]|nr:cyclase family protein [Pseudolysinimonas sp.]